MDRDIQKIQERYLELVQAIIATDLAPATKLMKMGLEYRKMQSKIKDEILNYQIELHLNELPFDNGGDIIHIISPFKNETKI